MVSVRSKINFGGIKTDLIRNVHRHTAMQMLTSSSLKRGELYKSAVHDMPVATTVKIKDADTMKAAFRSLIEFNPDLHDEIPGIDQIYRRIGSEVEVYYNWGITLAEGVDPNKYWALTFSDGMRAINCLLEFMTKPGDEFIVGKPLYGCTDNYFSGTALNKGYVIKYADFTDPNNIVSALSKKTKIIYFETVTNPNLRVYDLPAISKLAKEYNPDIKVIVDNTFPSPAGCNPLLHGADMVAHSATKSLGGFSQEMAGIAIVPKQYWAPLFMYRKNTGGVAAPQQVHNLLTRGLPTLYSRFNEMQANAGQVATFLNSNKKIQETIYPGLEENYKYFGNAQKILTDWDGEFAPGFMISFTPQGSTEKARVRHAKNIIDFISEKGHGIITHAVSLGGNKSLIEMPYLGTHATVSPEEKSKWGIDGGMIRLSVGLGHYEDIISLLDAAIKKM